MSVTLAIDTGLPEIDDGIVILPDSFREDLAKPEKPTVTGSGAGPGRLRKKHPRKPSRPKTRTTHVEFGENPMDGNPLYGTTVD